MNVKDKKFVILGGGITGCSLAWVLESLGAKTQIIERESNCGGLARSYSLDGFSYDFGPHILHAKKESTINFYKKLELRMVDYYTKMVFNDDVKCLVDFPFSSDIFAQLPQDIAIKVKEELENLDRTKIDNTNIETYLSSVYGETLYKLFNYGYTKKFWGKEPKDVPSNGAAGWINFRSDDKRLFSEWQAYPKGDLNDIFKWLTKDLNITKASVQGLGEVRNGEVQSVKTDAGDIKGDHFISTIQPEILFPHEQYKMEYIGKVIVFLRVDRGPVLPEGIGGLYFPNGCGFNRVVEYPAMNSSSYPKLNGSLLGVEYPYFVGQSQEEQKVYEDDAVKEVEKHFDCKVMKTNVMKHKAVYPVKTPEQIDLFKNYFGKKADEISNLSMTGRYGRFVYVNMNNCFEMAMDLVAKISGIHVKELVVEVGL